MVDASRQEKQSISGQRLPGQSGKIKGISVLSTLTEVASTVRKKIKEDTANLSGWCAEAKEPRANTADRQKPGTFEKEYSLLNYSKEVSKTRPNWRSMVSLSVFF